MKDEQVVLTELVAHTPFLWGWLTAASLSLPIVSSWSERLLGSISSSGNTGGTITFFVEVPDEDLGGTWGQTGPRTPLSYHKDLYDTIDATDIGHIPWQSFVISHDGKMPQQPEVPSWMKVKHTVWFHDPCLLVHNILSNPDFKDTFNTSPYQEYDPKNNHWYHDFMSGNWTWQHVAILSLCMLLYQHLSIFVGYDYWRPHNTFFHACTYHPW